VTTRGVAPRRRRHRCRPRPHATPDGLPAHERDRCLHLVAACRHGSRLRDVPRSPSPSPGALAEGCIRQPQRGAPTQVARTSPTADAPLPCSVRARRWRCRHRLDGPGPAVSDDDRAGLTEARSRTARMRVSGTRRPSHRATPWNVGCRPRRSCRRRSRGAGIAKAYCCTGALARRARGVRRRRASVTSGTAGSDHGARPVRHPQVSTSK
jgi:hypothetical protein